MEFGKFYFIKDQYFVDYPDGKLMLNRERDEHGKFHRRPCYYAVQDLKNPEIYWFVPISKQVDKFKVHYDKKVQQHGECDTICFGYVLGTHAAFLIQNMCPVTDEYVDELYVDYKTNIAVGIKPEMAQEVERKARKVLNLYRRGKTFLIFPDVVKIEAQLIARINMTKTEVAASQTEAAATNQE